MWSDHHLHHQRGVSSSTSKSYSSNSSSSSSILQPAPRKARTMDEVWNNITHHNHYGTTMVTPHQTSTRGMILQDFLAGPIRKETTASSTIQPPHLPPDMSVLPPATVLSLNSTGFDFILGNNKVDQNHTHLSSSPFMTTTPFSDAIGSPGPELLSFCGKKRLSEQPSLDSSGDCSGDRRHKRMIKNRESAARSRARKQAYTNELEVEVTHLNEENQRLRKQYEEVRMALAAQAPTKKKLHRTSTAPF